MSKRPKYLGTRKGDILKTIVIDGARSWDEIRELTGLEPNLLNKALSEMYDEGVIKKKRDRTYRVISHIYYKYKQFFEKSAVSLSDLFESAFEKWDSKRSKYINRKEEVYNLLKYDLKDAVFQTITSLGFSNKIVESSVGISQWARVPWITIRDGRVSSSVRDGVFVSYLFYLDSSVYIWQSALEHIMKT